MKLGSSALQLRFAGVSVRSYTVIRGDNYRKPCIAPPIIDLAEADEGESGHGWCLYARPHEDMGLAQAANTPNARTLQLVQAGSKG